MILILTNRDDSTSDPIERQLRARGARVVRFDPGDLPARAACSLRFDAATGWHRVIEPASEPPIDLATVTAAWIRRPSKRELPDDVTDPVAREYLREEWRDLVADLFAGMTCRWVPACPAVLRLRQLKCHPLMLAHQLGFTIPDSAFTSRPEDLFALHRAHDGNVITKMPTPLAFPAGFPGIVRYTERVTARDLGYARRLRHSPVLIQANIAKHSELRVTVVGDQVFAAEIDSQGTHRTRQDWRRYDHTNTVHRIHDLPAPVAQRCVELTRRLGLVYGAIDLILTPDGDYLFLEINPAGEFGWIEDVTGLPISQAIADLLVSGSGGGSIP